MALELHNQLSGRLERLKPARPPYVGLLWSREALAPGWEKARCQALVASLLDVLVYLGWQANQAVEDSGETVDLYCGALPPRRPVGLWIKAGPVEAGGTPRPRLPEDPAVRRLLLMAVPYRAVLRVSPESVRSAEEAVGRLRAARAGLEESHGRLAPNPRALAGYARRLRAALENDLDIPGALAGVFDALRPGALSPGSRLAALDEAEQFLGAGVSS